MEIDISDSTKHRRGKIESINSLMSMGKNRLYAQRDLSRVVEDYFRKLFGFVFHLSFLTLIGVFLGQLKFY
ncbi:hypothetical protein Bca4012_078808 [Brassica carinata]